MPWGAVSMPHKNTWPYDYASIWTQNNITSSISCSFAGLGYKCQKAFWLFPIIKSSFTEWESATIVLIPNNVALIGRKFSREPPKSLEQWQSPWDKYLASLDDCSAGKGTLLNGYILVYLPTNPSHYLNITVHGGNMFLSLKIRLCFKDCLKNPLYPTWEHSPSNSPPRHGQVRISPFILEAGEV